MDKTPPGYAPVPQGDPAAVYIVQPSPGVMMNPNAWIAQCGNRPVNMTCPNCRKNIVTNIHHELGLLVWLSAFFLFLFTFCLCWIPCLINGMKDVVHTCPSCGAYVGRYNRI